MPGSSCAADSPGPPFGAHQLKNPHAGIAKHADNQLVACRARRVLEPLNLFPAQDVLDWPAEFGQCDLAIWHFILILDTRLLVSRADQHVKKWASTRSCRQRSSRSSESKLER